jgi:hypothetical protein
MRLMVEDGQARADEKALALVEAGIAALPEDYPDRANAVDMLTGFLGEQNAAQIAIRIFQAGLPEAVLTDAVNTLSQEEQDSVWLGVSIVHGLTHGDITQPFRMDPGGEFHYFNS